MTSKPSREDRTATERDAELFLKHPRELRAELDKARAEVELLRAQHDRVRELHTPEKQQGQTWCAHDDNAWPCPTYTALPEPAALDEFDRAERNTE